MSIRWLLFLGGISLACQGCTPLSHIVRTLIVEPTNYPRRLADLEDKSVNKKIAKIAWQDFQVCHPDIGYSEHFARGFKTGYADYLYAGGSGAPPPLPPRYYWRGNFETAQGHEAIRDWFAGFRQGAESAKESGLRELVTLPSSLSEPPPAALRQPAEVLPPDEKLPPPKKEPRGDGRVPLSKEALGDGRVPAPAAARQKPMDGVVQASYQVEQREVLPASARPPKNTSVYGGIRVPSAAASMPADRVLGASGPLPPRKELSPAEVLPPE